MIAGNQGNMGADLYVDDARFVVHSTDFVSLAYEFRGSGRKPFVRTLVGPSGRNMLDAPAADHAHHLGIWWGHGDVSGVDFYLEMPREDLPAGRIEHAGFDEIVDAAPRFGFTEQLRWVGPDGGVMITEQRSLRVDFTHDLHYAVDLESTYTACRDLVFGDTKESVLPGIRPAAQLSVHAGATMVNSRGGVGEAGCMGKPAAWLDVSATRPGLYWKQVAEGIACFDHPGNPHHETTWFARDYGVVSPFEGHHFLGGGTMAGGETLHTRHRIFVHKGDAESADVAGAYREYAAT
jgi:Family of unknown function (DUF6807)